MFVFFWVTLLFSVWGSKANTDMLAGGKQHCTNGFCVTLSEGNITADTGHSVVIPCSFTTIDDFTPLYILWFKCSPSKIRCEYADMIFHSNKNNRHAQSILQSGFQGRLSLLEPDVSQRNCSIMINDLNESDSGSYQLRLNGVRRGTSDIFTFPLRAIVSVKDVKKIEITGDRSVKEGETLNVTCSVDSFPPSFITWTKYSEESIQNVTGDNLQNNTEMDTLFISNVTTEDSGQYICTAKHLNNTLMEKVIVNVIYKRTPLLTGDTTVTEGETLNVTCSVDSFPPSLITWTKLSSNTILHNNTGSASLVISDVTTEDSGQYVCTATHLNTTVTLHADVTVTCLLKILSSSRCEVQSEVLTCVCITEGFPLTTIKWPLLESHTKYSVMTTVSDHTVNSSIILSVKDHGYTEVECVASSDVGEVKRNLVIIKTDQEGLLRHHGCYSGVLFWAVAGSSISVNVLFIICILGLWNARKKVNPNEENRTYMSLQKPDPSSEYEVIALRQN
ncbi:hemicentin-1-like isoform X2 [Mugil cephalus]|uniref:hemicentin-1-like isoform X2 n=1 Tax=Mugil cephalus TaxID=48193 RepID=UPI001FB6202E|nr:hemicentin-1-like isoform X2 [Mugil cephalus]